MNSQVGQYISDGRALVFRASVFLDFGLRAGSGSAKFARMGGRAGIYVLAGTYFGYPA